MYKRFYLFLIITITIIKLIKASNDISEKCSDSIICAEKEMIDYVDRIDNTTETVPILGDFLVLEKNQQQLETGRSETDLIERCIQFLLNHEIKLKFPKEIARSLSDEPRTRRLKKILLPLLILLKLKAVIVVPAILSLIALVAFKGLGAGLMALIISGATALKTFIENQSSKLTYEVLPQFPMPHWSRAGFEPGYEAVF